MHIKYERKLSVAYSGPFIDDVAPPSQKTLWFGILYLFPTVGIAVGYIFGGVIGASMGWRMPFLIQVSLMLWLLYLQDLHCWLRIVDHPVPEHLLLLSSIQAWRPEHFKSLLVSGTPVLASRNLWQGAHCLNSKVTEVSLYTGCRVSSSVMSAGEG